jgi:hypothetical protein
MSGSSGREYRTRHGPRGRAGPIRGHFYGYLQVLEEVPEMGRFGKGCIKYKTYRGEVGSFRKSIVVFLSLSAKDGISKIGPTRTTAAIVTSRVGIRVQSSI